MWKHTCLLKFKYCCRCLATLRHIGASRFQEFCCAQCSTRNEGHVLVNIASSQTERAQCVWVNAEQATGSLSDLAGRPHAQELSGLTRIEFSRQIKEIPRWLSICTYLTSLDLSHCYNLRELPPEIGKLTQLTSMLLTDCRNMTELPTEIANLRRLTTLDLTGCKLQTPPPEVVEKGTNHILEFLSDLGRARGVTSNTRKLILLGDQRAGKSSLLDNLMNYESNHGKGSIRPENDRTVGLDIVTWRPDPTKSLIFNVFDAGGHKIYRATHPLIMSTGSLHLVMTNLSEEMGRAKCSGAGTRAMDWIDTIQAKVPGAAIAVIGTHMDMTGPSAAEETLKNIMQEFEKGEQDAVKDAWKHLTDLEKHVIFADSDSEKCNRWHAQNSENKIRWDALRHERDELVFRDVSKFDEKSKETSKYGCGGSIKYLIERQYALSHSSTRLDIRSIHTQMEKIESESLSENMCLELKRKRKQWQDRPQLLFASAVSSLTGEGIIDLKCALQIVAVDCNVFEGERKVPLSYVVLDHCCKQTKSDTDLTSSTIRSWAVQDYMTTNECFKKLEAVCKEPYVKFSDLVRVLGECGIGEKEVERAVKYLHRTGSILYFDESPDEILRSTVIIRVSSITDAFKYIIHESSPWELNNELRELEARVLRDMHLKSGLEDLKECGILSSALLEFLWKTPRQHWDDTTKDWYGSQKFPVKCHELLVALMKSFCLMYRVGKSNEYIIPLMFHDSLPQCCDKDKIWIPAGSDEASAWMRCCYESSKRLPEGFISLLQVEWMSHENSIMRCASIHHAQNGTVMHGTGLGGSTNCVEEHVVIHLDRSERMARLSVVAWAQICRQSQNDDTGNTTWALFRAVTSSIEEALLKFPGFSMLKSSVWLSSNKPIFLTTQSALRYLSQDDALKDPKSTLCVDNCAVALEEIFPIQRQVRAMSVSCRTVAPTGRQKILACRAEHSRNLQLGAEFCHIGLVVSGSFEFIEVNLESTDDMFKSILSDLTPDVVHMSGHTGELGTFMEQLLEWVTEGKVKPKCVFLNCCESDKMGMKLQKAGVSYVVCWRTLANDSACNVLSKTFYSRLGETPCSFGIAFAYALDRLHTNWWVQESRHSTDVCGGRAVLFFKDTREIDPEWTKTNNSIVGVYPRCEVVRSWIPGEGPSNKAGLHEKEALRYLNFNLKHGDMEIGTEIAQGGDVVELEYHGLGPGGKVKKEIIKDLDPEGGVEEYWQLFQVSAVRKAASAGVDNLKKAIECLEKGLECRHQAQLEKFGELLLEHIITKELLSAAKKALALKLRKELLLIVEKLDVSSFEFLVIGESRHTLDVIAQIMQDPEFAAKVLEYLQPYPISVEIERNSPIFRGGRAVAIGTLKLTRAITAKDKNLIELSGKKARNFKRHAFMMDVIRPCIKELCNTLQRMMNEAQGNQHVSATPPGAPQPELEESQGDAQCREYLERNWNSKMSATATTFTTSITNPASPLPAVPSPWAAAAAGEERAESVWPLAAAATVDAASVGGLGREQFSLSSLPAAPQPSHSLSSAVAATAADTPEMGIEDVASACRAEEEEAAMGASNASSVVELAFEIDKTMKVNSLYRLNLAEECLIMMNRRALA